MVAGMDIGRRLVRPETAQASTGLGPGFFLFRLSLYLSPRPSIVLVLVIVLVLASILSIVHRFENENDHEYDRWTRSL